MAHLDSPYPDLQDVLEIQVLAPTDEERSLSTGERSLSTGDQSPSTGDRPPSSRERPFSSGEHAASSRPCHVHVRSLSHGEASSSTTLDPDNRYLIDLIGALEQRTLDRAGQEELGELLLKGSYEYELEGLLKGPTYQVFQRCMGALQADKGRRLLLALFIDAPDLATLPWEYLFDPDLKIFLAADSQVAVCRSLSAARQVRTMVVPRPVRGLLVESGAADLDHKEEAKRLLRRSFLRPRPIRWDVLSGEVTVEALHAQLKKGQYQILHFIGHGDYENEGKLILEGTRKQVVGERTVADLADAHSSLRLVVLNACDTARADPSSASSGVAGQLISRGVPAVIAMQQPISDQSAQRFSVALYGALINGDRPGDILEAMNEARQAVHLQEETRSLEFAFPVLYLRSRGARLFEVTPKFFDLRRWLLLLLALLVILPTCATLRWLGVLEGSDVFRQDLYVGLVEGPAYHPDVVIVDLDDITTDQGTEVWPQWHRGTFVGLVRRLLREIRARALIVDVRLRPNPGLEDPGAFLAANVDLGKLIEQARQDGQPVVLATSGTLLPPEGLDGRYRLVDVKVLPTGLEKASTGYATLLRPGQEGRPARRVALTARQPGHPDAYALAAAGVAGLRSPVVNERNSRILIGDHWIDTDAFFRVELPIIGDDIPVVEASRVMARPVEEGVRLRLRDKVIVMGLYHNPDNDVIPTRWGSRPGVAVQAGLVAALLAGRSRHRWDTSLDITLQVLCMTALVFWLSRRSARRRLWLKTALAVSALIGLEIVTLELAGLWINAPVLEAAVLGILAGLWPSRTRQTGE